MVYGLRVPTDAEVRERNERTTNFHDAFITAMNQLTAENDRITIRDNGHWNVPFLYVDGGHEHAYVFYAGVSDDGSGFFSLSYDQASTDSHQDLVHMTYQPFKSPFTFAAIIVEFVNAHIESGFQPRVKSPIERFC